MPMMSPPPTRPAAIAALWTMRLMKNLHGGIGRIIITGSGNGPVTLRLNGISLSLVLSYDYHPPWCCAKFDVINWRTDAEDWFDRATRRQEKQQQAVRSGAREGRQEASRYRSDQRLRQASRR